MTCWCMNQISKSNIVTGSYLSTYVTSQVWGSSCFLQANAVICFFLYSTLAKYLLVAFHKIHQMSCFPLCHYDSSQLQQRAATSKVVDIIVMNTVATTISPNSLSFTLQFVTLIRGTSPNNFHEMQRCACQTAKTQRRAGCVHKPATDSTHTNMAFVHMLNMSLQEHLHTRYLVSKFVYRSPNQSCLRVSTSLAIAKFSWSIRSPGATQCAR